MELIPTLLKGNSRANRDRIARWIGSDRKRFAELMSVYLGTERREAQLASGVLTIITDKHPELLTPWLPKIVQSVTNTEAHDAVRRAAVRTLMFIDIPRSLAGKAANACFAYLADISQPIAIRAFSMIVLKNIARKEPAFRNELRLTIEVILPYSTAALKSCARRTLKEFSAS